MQIGQHAVVILKYTLKNNDGDVLDQSNDGSFAYLHGAQNILPGLENALDGKQAGDTLSVAIPAAEGYGERDDARIQQVPREMFPADQQIDPGMQFQAQGPDGQVMIVTIAAVEGDQITVDGNHPMAGIDLNFDVEVAEVREASAEEIEHGHVHGPGGHHHG